MKISRISSPKTASSQQSAVMPKQQYMANLPSRTNVRSSYSHLVTCHSMKHTFYRSEATATSSFLNRINTPSNELLSSGPCSSSLFSAVPSNLATASYTTLTIDLFGLITPGGEGTMSGCWYQPLLFPTISLHNPSLCSHS